MDQMDRWVAHIHRASATSAYAGIFPPDDLFPWDETLVLEANTRARQFYERRGWSADGARTEHHTVVVLRYRRPSRGIST